VGGWHVGAPPPAGAPQERRLTPPVESSRVESSRVESSRTSGERAAPVIGEDRWHKWPNLVGEDRWHRWRRRRWRQGRLRSQRLRL